MNPADDDQCKHADYVTPPGPEGYISPKAARESNAGSLTCPWQLVAQQGQRINVSIIDFNPVTDAINCIPIAYITDIKSRENRTVCKSNERNQHAYLSTNNTMQIQILTTSESVDYQEEFLLHYKGNAIA